jgi:hypothetical protein
MREADLTIATEVLLTWLERLMAGIDCAVI